MERLWCHLSVPFLLTACGSATQADSNAVHVVTVQVEVGDMTLPAAAEISVRVVEVSGPDRAVVGSLTALAGQPQYRVECKASRIRETQSYGLEVAAVVGGRAVCMNKAPHYVFTKG